MAAQSNTGNKSECKLLVTKIKLDQEENNVKDEEKGRVQQLNPDTYCCD